MPTSLARRVLVLHGPNLSRLGRREPAVYGTLTLAEVDAAVATLAASLGAEVSALQSNHEGTLLDALLKADDDGYCGVLLNAGALAHTSLALADGVRAVAPLPVIEVHLTNTAAREEARQVVVVGAACRARVEGFGVDSYLLGLRGLLALVDGG